MIEALQHEMDCVGFNVSDASIMSSNKMFGEKSRLCVGQS